MLLKQIKISSVIKTAFYFNRTIKMLKFTAAEPKWEETSAWTQHLWSVKTKSELRLFFLLPRGSQLTLFPWKAPGCWTAATAPLSSNSKKHFVSKKHYLQCLMHSCLKRNTKQRDCSVLFNKSESQVARPGNTTRILRLSSRALYQAACSTKSSITCYHQITV